MNNIYHVLNGDSLKKQFPTQLTGQIIVARECLIEGDVSGSDLDDFFERRANFISKYYGQYSKEEYFRSTVTEFEKLMNIPAESTINLWFEDDLFCQVNFWFTTWLISEYLENVRVFIVRPKEHTRFGFAGYRQNELVNIYTQRHQIHDLEKVSLLWQLYRRDHLEKLLKISEELEAEFPFILKAVKAHLERIPTKTDPGRHVRTLINIMDELQTREFVPIFKEFCKREPIYGFGDLQVEHMLKKIVKQS